MWLEIDHIKPYHALATGLIGLPLDDLDQHERLRGENTETKCKLTRRYSHLSVYDMVYSLKR